MNWFFKRLSEPSTYAGLAGVTLGAGTLLKAHEAPQIAASIEQAAPALSSGDWFAGLAVLASGVAAAFMKEKGRR